MARSELRRRDADLAERRDDMPLVRCELFLKIKMQKWRDAPQHKKKRDDDAPPKRLRNGEDSPVAVAHRTVRIGIKPEPGTMLRLDPEAMYSRVCVKTIAWDEATCLPVLECTVMIPWRDRKTYDSQEELEQDLADQGWTFTRLLPGREPWQPDYYDTGGTVEV